MSTVTTDEILSRLSAELSARQSRGAAVIQPQALLPSDAAEFEALISYPWKRAIGSSESIGARELACGPEQTLVRRLFRVLLLREPTAEESRRGSSLLERGVAPELLMAQLRWSNEGRKAGIKVRGIARSLPSALARSLVRFTGESIGKAKVARTAIESQQQPTKTATPTISTQPDARGMDVASTQLPLPVLSICVTTYNRAAWLERSLPLILQQASPYPDLVEVVVCDNTSPDNTPEVAKRLQNTYAFAYYRNETNVGMLGNLGVSCDKARGQYIWVIGDDDLMVDGTVERVLAAIAKHPRTELIYTNYAYTRFNSPKDIEDVGSVICGAKAVSTQVQDVFAERVSDIATKSENCFTAIYCLIYRADHARAAYHQDVSGRPFSTLSTTVPTAEYVCRHLFDRPGYWIGDPCVVVNMNVSWLRYASLFILERFPELFDLMQEEGVDAGRMDVLRSKHVANIPNWFLKIYQGPDRENLPYFSPERLVKRFGHLPAFRAKWPQLRRVYAKAFRRGQVEDPTLTPQRLDEIFRLQAPTND